MTWQRFATAVPAIAEFARKEFEQSSVAVVGTIRSDGSPRISCVDPCVLDDTLYLGMMWQSRKALDLLRDPHIVVRNAICTNTGNEAEVSLRGTVTEIADPLVRIDFVEASGTPWKEPHFHLFSVDIQEAALVKYGGGRQSVTVWPQGLQFTRSYE